MKFVGDTLSISRVSDDRASHTVHLPFYHRAAVGLFPGTHVFVVPLPSSNEVVLTPIDPDTWGDLWRLEATLLDRPGAAKQIVETLVANKVNVLVHEGVTESTEQGQAVHQIFEILDLQRYANEIDGTTQERNSVNKPLLRPNRLIAELVTHGQGVLCQARGRDGWELSFERMAFFFRNKDSRVHAVDASVNINKDVHIPVGQLREMPYVTVTDQALPLHIMSDTEQKYVKLRILAPDRYYLLVEVEHAEKVGAIDTFMSVLRSYQANMIDCYSRLKTIAQTALFYALIEFDGGMTAEDVVSLVGEIRQSEMTRNVVLTGAVGHGPGLGDLALPSGVSHRLPDKEPLDRWAPAKPDPAPGGDGARHGETQLHLGAPYYLDRHEGPTWKLNNAQVFMAIPFAKGYKAFYDDFVATAVREAGLEPVRVDQMPQQAKRRHIIDRIEEGSARARFVIADVSGWNPNVVYEVGLAVGISKPILLLCDVQHFDAREIPFDFASYDLIEYSPYQANDLRDRLTEKIQEMKDATEA